MIKRKLSCPECGKDFHFRFMKQGFSGKIVCANCKEQLHVENRVFPYLLVAAMLFVCSDYVFAFVSQFALASWLNYLIVFVLLLIICIATITFLRLLLGNNFLYTVHSRKEFDEEKDRIDKMKKDLKKKKPQEKE